MRKASSTSEMQAHGDGFGVQVDLSRVFQDERGSCWVWVSARRPVRWLATRLAARLGPCGACGARALALLAPRGLLHPADPLALLEPGDIVRVIPVQTQLFKDECHGSANCASPCHKSKRKLRCQNCCSQTDERLCEDDIDSCTELLYKDDDDDDDDDDNICRMYEKSGVLNHKVKDKACDSQPKCCSFNHSVKDKACDSTDSQPKCCGLNHKVKDKACDSQPISCETQMTVCAVPRVDWSGTCIPDKSPLQTVKERALEMLNWYEKSLQSVSLSPPRASSNERSRSPPSASAREEGGAGDARGGGGPARRRRRVRRRPRRPLSPCTDVSQLARGAKAARDGPVVRDAAECAARDDCVVRAAALPAARDSSVVRNAATRAPSTPRLVHAFAL